MAYLVFTTDQYELDRRELTGDTMVIGRAVECDVAIRDILLSRTHCRIERRSGLWRVTDLESKNGTRVNGQRIIHHWLAENEPVRIGRTTLTFFSGDFVPAPPGTLRRTVARPVDPAEALEGTVAGFEYTEPPRTTKTVENFPQPQPAPREPAAYVREDVRGMLSELASSSWDMAICDAIRHPRTRELPMPNVRLSGASACDLSLQVWHDALVSPHTPMNSAQYALSIITILLAVAFFGVSAWIVLVQA